MTRNLPVPAGPRAPLSLRWLWWIGPPALITWLYRAVFPPRARRLWSLGSSTSHLALAMILAGYGWRAFIRFAWPFSGPGLGWKEDYGRGNRISVDWWRGGPLGLGWDPHRDMSVLDRGGKKGWYVNG